MYCRINSGLKMKTNNVFELKKLKIVTIEKNDEFKENLPYLKAIDEVYNNTDYKIIKSIIASDLTYGYYICVVIKNLTIDLIEDFIEFDKYCRKIQKLYLNLRNYSYNPQSITCIINAIYNIKNNIAWSDFVGNISEYIVLCRLKFDAFKYYNEPKIYYKKNLLFKNKSYKNKKFDILSQNKSNHFVLGEVKHKISSYLRFKDNKYILNNKILGQVQKINALQKHLNKSVDDNNKNPKAKKYIFTLHVIPEKSITNLSSDFEVLDIEDIFTSGFFKLEFQ